MRADTEQIDELIDSLPRQPYGTGSRREDCRDLVREVRKQDEALIRNFVAAIKLDRHDWEDWPEDSRKAFEALRAAQEDKSHDK